MQEKPSPIELKNLYRTATEFRKLAAWDWMNESDIFGVQNPRTGDIGYCSVLGGLGEVFALVLYMGGRGLKVHTDIQSGKIEPENPDALFLQDCLMASFENKDYMDKDDIRLIKKLNLNFRGSNSWPMFRRFRPGYVPIGPDRAEVLFLTDALDQAITVCNQLLEDDSIVTPSDEGLYLVRVANTTDDGTVWTEQWRTAESAEDQPVSPAHIDDLRIRRIRNKAKQSSAIWEMDFFHAPAPVHEGGEPFFPYSILIADNASGFVHDVYLANKQEHEREFPERFLACIENTGLMPKEIMICREEVQGLIGPLAETLGIKIRVVKRLDAAAQAIKSMSEHFRKMQE